MTRHSRVGFGLLGLAALAIGTTSAQSLAEFPTTAPTGKVCVAVLEPEVQGDLPADQRKAVAGSLDTLLTESLAGRKEFTLVDRQALDKVLAEKTAGAAGLSKIAPADVAAPLRPFWSAGVLICPTLLGDTNKRPGGTVMIQAVRAQNGQLLAELIAPVQKLGADAIQKAIHAQLESFSQKISETLAADRGRPLVEVTGQVPGKLTRVQWMVDDLVDGARARVSFARQVALLTPRQPINTKEERLLRVMGLADARGSGDKTAMLNPGPDIRLSAELSETTTTGVAFDKTPIHLKLLLNKGSARAGSKDASTAIDGEVGQWEQVRAKALAWVDEELRGLGGASSQPGDGEERARKMAADELAAVSQWTAGPDGQRDDIDRSIQFQIIRRALRAVHLDPTNENAAYLVASTVNVLYDDGKRPQNPVTYDRVMAECQRYLDRFGRKVPRHHRNILHLLGGTGMVAAWNVPDHPARKGAIVGEPAPEIYRYSRVYVRAIAEYGYLGLTDELYADSNDFDIFGYHLAEYMIPHCPADRLDEEYGWWKEWFAKHPNRVRKTQDHAPGSGPPAPWDLIEATFQARKKNPAAVREAFQRIAKTYPRSLTRLWGGDQYKHYIVPDYLKAAGDPQWKTWEPDFQAKATGVRISVEEMTGFMDRMMPVFPAATAAKDSPPVPVHAFVLPEEISKLAGARSISHPPAGGLLLADGEVWFTQPGAAWGVVESVKLCRAKMPKIPAAAGEAINVAPTPLPWPQRHDGDQVKDIDKTYVFCTHVQAAAAAAGGKCSVWIGTEKGIVRFDRAGGDWKGRWYTTRDGFPGDDTRSITPARFGGRDVLLIVGRANSSGSSQNVSALDLATDKVTLLFDGSGKDAMLAPSPAAKLKDGRVVLVEFLGQGGYGDVDLKDITEFVREGPWSPLAAVIPPGATTAAVWEGEWDGPARTNHFREISSKTAKPGGSVFKSQSLWVFPYQQVNNLFGSVYWRTPDAYAVQSQTPYFLTKFMVGGGDTIWIAGCPGINISEVTLFYGYRPAGVAANGSRVTDRWIGPFRSPDGRWMTSLVAAGADQLLLTTDASTYLVSQAELLAAADKAGLVSDAETIRRKTADAMAKAGWRGQVPALILASQWDKALAALDEAERRPPSTQPGLPGRSEAKPGDDEAVRLRLWRAHILARMPGGLDRAICAYKAVAEDGSAGSSAKVFARVNQVFLLHKAERFPEVIELGDRVFEEFPQARPAGSYPGLNWYIQDARRKIGSSKLPASRPEKEPP